MYKNTSRELALAPEPRVVPIYWDPHFRNVPSARSAFDEFLRTLFRSSWMRRLCELGVPPAQLMPSCVRSDPPPATLSKLELEHRLRDWLLQGTVTPSPNKREESLLYLVVTPLATELTLGALSSPADFSGYHDFTTCDPEAARGPTRSDRSLFYAAVPLIATGSEILDVHSLPVARELAEALLDRAKWLKASAPTKARTDEPGVQRGRAGSAPAPRKRALRSRAASTGAP